MVNIGATALVTEAATAIFGEAGVSAATGVMTVSMNFYSLSHIIVYHKMLGRHLIGRVYFWN